MALKSQAEADVGIGRASYFMYPTVREAFLGRKHCLCGASEVRKLV